MGNRTWVKIFCDNWFEGSIRQESPLVRSVFTDLLALCGRLGETGIISLPGGACGYTDEQFSAMLNISLEEWQEAKGRLLDHPETSENRIVINGANIIKIINWEKYQSEYEKRRDRSRNLIGRDDREERTDKISDNRTDKMTAAEGEGEGEVEKNRSKDQKKDQVRVTRTKTVRFTPPAPDEIREYCEARGNAVDPIRFHAHYTANGWKVGKNPMKNWKAAVVTWERNN